MIMLNKDKCIGCFKCIRVCPAKFANRVVDGNKVDINYDLCISCGHCISACEHDARYYLDNTEDFIADLAQGKSFIAIVAPAARANFDIVKLNKTLRTLGVKKVFDVSFGADICSWAHLKYLEKTKNRKLITQPCPVIVDYILKVKKELRDYLSPIHSPMACLAIFLRKYLGLKDDIVFISPCIGKENEIKRLGFIKYNVTFSKLLDNEKFKKVYDRLDNGLEKSDAYDDDGFDTLGKEFKTGLGKLYSKPGGLKENIKFYNPKIKIRQVEGQYAYEYLDEFDKARDEFKPDVVDILNCQHGCNKGPATFNLKNSDEIEREFENIRNNTIKKWSDRIRLKKLYSRFDKILRLDDFFVQYPVYNDILREPSEKELEEIFNRMLKYTKEERSVDCTACGYSSCLEMAKAIYNQLNIESNCIYYDKKLIEKEREEIENKSLELEQLTQQLNKNNEKLSSLIKEVKNTINVLSHSMGEVSIGYSENAKEVENIAMAAGSLVDKMTNLKDLGAHLEEKVQFITNAYTLIKDIGENISIYALNASIEAAKTDTTAGFNVIASEIRKLAETIKSNMKTLEKEINSVVELMRSIPKEINSNLRLIEDINAAITNESAIIEELTAKGEEISSEIMQLEQFVNDVVKDLNLGAGA